MSPLNPYTTHEPYMWAGDYLCFRGKIVGLVRYDSTNEQSPPWIGAPLISKLGQLLPADKAVAVDLRSSSRVAAMLRLQEWLSDLIMSRQSVLDEFCGPAHQ